MTYFPDLGNETQIDQGAHVRAIGWLSHEYPFPVGDSPAPFIARLEEYCRDWGSSVDALNWAVAAGPHTCELCGVFHASGNLAIPAKGVMYVAPQMIGHYVTAHRYLPPTEFIAVVLAAPRPESPEYSEALRPFKWSDV